MVKVTMTITNVASVTSDTFDPDRGNNVDSGSDGNQTVGALAPPPPPQPAPSAPAPVAPIVVGLPYADVRIDIPEVPTLTFPSPEPVKELPSLAVVDKIPDQYADTGARSSFAIPLSAFAHSNPTEMLTLSATLANGQKLPDWIRFDATSGNFVFEAPPSFVGELRIKVTARDSKGTEVSTIFRFNVGKMAEATKATKAPAGRASLSDQLRMASREAGFSFGKTDAKIATRPDVKKAA